MSSSIKGESRTMAESKAVKEVKLTPSTWIDPWTTPQDDWEYFSVPEKDIFGKAHPGFSLNRHEFKPGQRYLVPPEVARTLQERSDVFNKYTARLLQDTIDYDAIRAVGPIQ